MTARHAVDPHAVGPHAVDPHAVDRRLSRRALLQAVGASGLATLLDACARTTGAAPAASRVEGSARDRAATGAGAGRAGNGGSANGGAVNDARTLVVIELTGGNDGFATLVPVADARLRRLRERIWIDPAELHRIDDAYSCAKGLAPVASQLAFVQGVGVAKPDLSHFAMQQRWWSGDPDGTSVLRTGFLGRCCDVLAPEQAVAGASIGAGASPALVSERAVTVSLPDLALVHDLTKDEPDERRILDALRTMASDPGARRARREGARSAGAPGAAGASDAGRPVDDLLALARSGLGAALELAGVIGAVGEAPKRYPDSDLARQLASIRQLVSAGSGIRVFHVPWGGFDTHTNETGTHADLMNRLGAALAAFRDDCAEHGLSDHVLVATTSEFGRRAEANAGGTDHGTASTMLLLGPVRPGVHGAAVDLRRLDADGNVRATVAMGDYYATLATWLGVDPSAVAPKGSALLDGVIR